MKKLLALIFLAAVIYGMWWFFFRDKPEAIVIKDKPIQLTANSSAFNSSLSKVMIAYFDMKKAFVEADTSMVKEYNRKFLILLDSLKTSGDNSDSLAVSQTAAMLVSDIKANATAIQAETDITEMRQDFRMVSENLYPYLKVVKYSGPTLYWQNCPMAFGEDKEASWVSNTEEIVNPYLGKHHPEYKNAMLHCGEIKDTIK